MNRRQFSLLCILIISILAGIYTYIGFNIFSGQAPAKDKPEPLQSKTLLTPSAPLIKTVPKPEEQSEHELKQEPEPESKPELEPKSEPSITNPKRKRNLERTSLIPEQKNAEKPKSLSEEPPVFVAPEISHSFNVYIALIVIALILTLIHRQPSSII